MGRSPWQQWWRKQPNLSQQTIVYKVTGHPVEMTIFSQICLTSLAEEAAAVVKVQRPKVAPTHELVGDLALELLEEVEHLVVGVPREHYLAGVELVDRRPEAPQVEVEVVLEAEDDLGRAVKPRYQVGRDVGTGMRNESDSDCK